MNRCLFLVIGVSAWMACGCRGIGTRGAESGEGSIAPSTGSADLSWSAVENTLRRYRFPIDRLDRSAGIITTLPEMSRHWFEFWRYDAVTSRDRFESTVNPIRRWVEVDLGRGEGGTWETISVAVYKERLSVPDRQFNSSAAVFQFFGESLPSTTGAIRVTAKDEQWVPLGRDSAMEDYLLAKILRAAPMLSATERGDSGPPVETK